MSVKGVAMARRLIAPVLVFLLGCGAAHAQHMGQLIAFDPPTTPIGVEQIAADGRPLLVQTMRSARNVKLLAPIRSDANPDIPPKIDLAAGVVLQGASLDGTVFCTALKAVSGYCLEDTDKDGKFDVLYYAYQTSASGAYLAFSVEGYVTPGQFNKPRRLAAPVPYAEVSLGEAISATVQIKLQPVPFTRSATRPFKANLIASLGTLPIYPMSAHSAEFMLDPQGVTRATVAGAVIEILGYAANGSVRYRVLRAIPPGPSQMATTPFPR